MRDILFKAKRLRDGEWVEGVPVDLTPSYCFESDSNAPQEWVMARGDFADWGLPRDVVFEKIDPDTICECTGIKDTCGNFIYENDVVRYDYKNFRPNLYQIIYEKGAFMLTNGIELIEISDIVKNEIIECVEVVGNIYDEKDV